MGQLRIITLPKMIIDALHRPQINSLFLLALIPETLPNRGIFGEVTQSSVAPDESYPKFRPNRFANSIRTFYKTLVEALSECPSHSMLVRNAMIKTSN
jgi:hypothetical protein